MLKAIAAAAALFVSSIVAQAAGEWPSQPIKIIVPFPAGGGTDTSIRMIAPKISEELGQPVIVENRVGAKGSIGSNEVARSTDGHTFLFQTSSVTIDAHLRKNLPYDLKRDFVPVTIVCEGPYVLTVTGSLPVGNVQEFVAYAKGHPGKVLVGNSGIGAGNHMVAELFKAKTGIDVVMVPYKGSGESMPALLSGEHQATFQVIPSIAKWVEDGKLKALAVTSDKRNTALPDVPTLQESGLEGYSDTIWFGMFAPANVPEGAVERMHKAISVAVQDEKSTAAYAAMGMEPIANTPEDFQGLVDAGMEKWKHIIEDNNLSIDE